MKGLIPLDEARTRLLGLVRPTEVETTPLAAAAGRWLAADVVALRDQPWADLSAMDGYAIRHAERPGPWHLAGTSAAGSGMPAPLAEGQTLRIFTGAPMPPGADCVLVQEEAARDGDHVSLAGEGPARPGQHVRRAGSDFAAGQRLAQAGDRLTPARVALLALGGHGHVPVHRRPRVALLSTGDELVEPGMPTSPGRLPASNALMLAALLAPLGCEIVDLGIVPDQQAPLAAAIAREADADILVTTGGASVGDHDLVRPTLLEAGAMLDFWRIALKPGKPLMAGRLGGSLVLGLPGNPVSALVTARLFAVPAIRAMLGCPQPVEALRHATAGAALPPTTSRTEFLRARLVPAMPLPVAMPLSDQDSAATRALAAADVLIHRPAGSDAVRQGDSVEILDLY